MLADCLANVKPGVLASDINCIVNLTATKEAPVALLPDYDGYNDHLVAPGATDSSGTVWEMMTGTAGGQAPNGQYFAKVISDGTVTVYPFTVPGDTGTVFGMPEPPVITGNGGIWFMSSSAPSSGKLVEVIPKR